MLSYHVVSLFARVPTALIRYVLARGFRLSRDEAARLNFSTSVALQPGDDIASILGVAHNLHCLVSHAFRRVDLANICMKRWIRQAMFPEYYYPGATEETLAEHKSHNCQYTA